jgi:hypothetical protein
MRIVYILFAACILLFTSCSNAGTSPKTATGDTVNNVAKGPPQSKLKEDGTQKLMAVVTSYYALKNAMVATKADDAGKAATQLATATDSLQSYMQKDSVNMAALKPYADTIITQSTLAATISDPSCEKQRIAFGSISSALYGILKKADLQNANIYHEYCPMAFNEKGATWLSNESDIKNPYFGKKMMECGEVTDSL